MRRAQLARLDCQILGAHPRFVASGGHPTSGVAPSNLLASGERDAILSHIRMQIRRRVLPVLFVWIVIAAAAGSPSIAAALSFVFICVLATRIGYGGRW